MFKKVVSMAIIIFSIIYFAMTNEVFSITKTPALWVSVNNTTFGQNIPANTSDVQAALESLNTMNITSAVTSVNGQTGVVNLTTANVTDSLNKRYITDAKLAVLNNTTNTNSGDQDLSVFYNKTSSDLRYIQTEVDPVFNASAAKNISSGNITSWDSKLDNPLMSTGDIIYAVNSTPTRLAGTNSTTLKFLSQVGNGTAVTSTSWQTVPSQGTLSYYLTNTTSDVSSDKKMLTTPVANKTAILYSGISTTQKLQDFVTEPNFPSISFIPAGEYQFHIHASSSNPNTGNLYAEFWEVNTTGSDVGLIGTSESTATWGGLSTSETEYVLSLVDPNVYTLASTLSRIVCRVWFLRTSGTHNVSLYVGDSADSHISLPSNTVDATNFVPYSGATLNVDLGSKHISTTGQGAFGNAVVSTLLPSTEILDVRNNNTWSQLHFSGTNATSDGFMTAATPNNFFASGGSYWNGTAGSWVAADPSSIIFGGFSGEFDIYSNTGLTPGNNFTATNVLRVDSSGNGVFKGALTAANNIIGVLRHFIFTHVSPATMYVTNATWCGPIAPANLTISNIKANANIDPTTELTGDIKYADACIGLGNPIEIGSFNTTNGTVNTNVSVAVPSGKTIYMTYTSAPDSAIAGVTYDLTYNITQ